MQPLILLHGALGAAKSMLSLCHVLDPLAEVHVLDFSGHGEARWPESGFTMERFEQDVLDLMDARDLPSAHIFGYSLGGFVGMKLALKVPDRIKSITTLATKFDWTPESCALESQKLNPDLLESKAPKYAQILTQIHKRNGWRTVVDETSGFLADMHIHRFSEEELSRIHTPIRLMVGDSDKMVSIHETTEASQMLPNADLVILPGTSHPLEHADRHMLASHIVNKLSGK